MCRHVHVTLSAGQKAASRKLSGIVIPVYTSIVLAVVAVTGSPQRSELVASSSLPAASH